MTHRFLQLTATLLLPLLAVSQQHLFRTPVDTTVPTPASVLGYELGDRFTDYRLLERYCLSVADASPRVLEVEYGHSYEDRPLRVLIVSSPDNLSRLDDIRRRNLQLTDPRKLSATEKAAVLKDLPGIVWFSFGIHGNESSSPEAALALLYQLAAGNDPATLRLLKDLVIILDPSLNPDGRERYVTWVNSVSQSPPNPDPDAREHAEEWPGGRTNHYYFDLNRDWSWLSQQESAARVGFYRTWMPHTHVDFHEMGHESSYFFFPATKPFHVTLPQSVQTWGTAYGKANAAALDSIGSPYYTGERFDMFYPGYGDSWPTFNGGIGMTYEQAGSGRAGLAIRRSDGATLTLYERLRNHFVTALATLELTQQRREERIRDFADFWTSALEDFRGKGVFLLSGDQDQTLLSECAALLMAQGIEVWTLREDERVSATRFYDTRERTRTFPKGSLVIPVGQPHARLVTALLEPRTVAKEDFYYDVSAWSLPVAYGLQAFESRASLPSSAQKLDHPPFPQGGLSGAERPLAYLVPWDRAASARLTVALLKDGHHLRVAEKSFVSGGREYRPGTIVMFAGNSDEIRRGYVDSLAREYGVDVVSVGTAWTDAGVSLGSDHVRPIHLPSVAVVSGDGVSPYDYGELWYYLEQELAFPFTPIGPERLGSAMLDQFDVLILPDGYRWKTIIDSTVTERLKVWMTRGGILLAFEDAGRQLRSAASGLTRGRLVGEKDKKDDKDTLADPEEKKKELFKTMTAFEKFEYERLNRIPGSIFEAVIDTTHPIGFGTDGRMYVLKSNGTPYALNPEGHAVARFSADTLQVSGYVPPGQGRRIAGSALIQEFQAGRGKAVVFSDPMLFRMLWKGTARLVANALLFLHRPEAE